jgi:hypothetical protein
MARRSPQGSAVAEVVLELEDPLCGECGRRMHVRNHRRRRVYSLAGPLLLNCKLRHCPDAACPNHRRTFSPEQELTLAMPRWLIGWDVFGWLGHRRFARHWSVPQLRAELFDSYTIVLSEDAIEDYLQRYQCMLAARQQDFDLLKKEYATTRQVMLSIDGLQPEKGHETLYVVRELGRQRVWFAKPLLSSATAEIRPLIVQAKEWAERLGCRIRLWMSDKQDAFVTAIARVCVRVCRIVTAATIFCVTWPSRCWSWTATRKCRCAAKHAVCVPSNARCCRNVPPRRPVETAVQSSRRARQCRRQTGWTSCSIIVQRFAASSTTVKAGRCVRPVCGCRKRLVKCADRWGVTSDSKKGTAGSAARTLGRLYRPRKKLGSGDAKTRSMICRDDS